MKSRFAKSWPKSANHISNFWYNFNSNVVSWLPQDRYKKVVYLLYSHTLYIICIVQRNWELLCTYIYYVSGDKALVEDSLHETAQGGHTLLAPVTTTC